MTARFVQRLGRTFEAVQVLDLYPSGISVDDLATMLSIEPADLLQQLAAFNRVGEQADPGASDVSYVEFLSRMPEPAEDSDDLYVEAGDAAFLRIGGSGSGAGAGLTVAEIGAVLVAAEDLLRTEPGNTALMEVVAEIRSRWLPGFTHDEGSSASAHHEGALLAAVQERRKVRITYDRWWEPGIVDRVIEPYRLVRTHRGFEVDAGPVDAEGSIRTYIVEQIIDLEVLDDGFERPADADRLSDDHRAVTRVEVLVPRDREWATEYLCEKVEVVARDDDTELRLDVIEPLRRRVGLLVLQTGPDSFVTAPRELQDADEELALELLAHHGLE